MGCPAGKFLRQAAFPNASSATNDDKAGRLLFKELFEHLKLSFASNKGVLHRETLGLVIRLCCLNDITKSTNIDLVMD
jgi:hypothetical protein